MSEDWNILDLGHLKQGIVDAITAGVCVPPPVGCGQIAVAFKDELSAREYRITGMCQVCQDKLEEYLTRLENESDEQDWADRDAEIEALAEEAEAGYEPDQLRPRVDLTGYLPDEEEPPF